MINLYNAQIEKIAFHRIGNKARNEGKFLAKEATVLNDEISPLLKEYYLKPFREKEENYLKFAHEVDLEFNEMHNLAKELLIAGNTNSDNFITLSQKVATLLCG